MYVNCKNHTHSWGFKVPVSRKSLCFTFYQLNHAQLFLSDQIVCIGVKLGVKIMLNYCLHMYFLRRVYCTACHYWYVFVSIYRKNKKLTVHNKIPKYGTTESFQVRQTTSVLDLKKKISDRLPISSDVQELYAHNGKLRVSDYISSHG